MDDNKEVTNNDVRDGFGMSCFYRPKNAVQVKSEKNDFYYKLDGKQRGLAVIFNHEHFMIARLKQRTGTNEDEVNLNNTLTRLGFDVRIFKDLNTHELFEQIDKLSTMDHSEYDCFAMCILTHGDEGCLYSRNSPYKHDDIFSRFTADNCKTLAGKPKLFFIQACQGDKLDPGVQVTTHTDSGPPSYRIPVFADFLFAYSTMPGHYSWRNTTRGSWFVQALCEVLNQNAYDYDLLTLLSLVNRKVALDFESNVPDNRAMHAQKQIPCISFTLTRIFQFPQISDNQQ